MNANEAWRARTHSVAREVMVGRARSGIVRQMRWTLLLAALALAACGGPPATGDDAGPRVDAAPDPADADCAAPESCNGADDDCDGTADEDFACVAGEATACTTSCGSAGTSTCTATCDVGACAPPAEECNGADDDCDSTFD